MALFDARILAVFGVVLFLSAAVFADGASSTSMPRHAATQIVKMK